MRKQSARAMSKWKDEVRVGKAIREMAKSSEEERLSREIEKMKEQQRNLILENYKLESDLVSSDLQAKLLKIAQPDDQEMDALFKKYNID